jgi:MoCo/4Fe-4S cofactor protein with predicted Tat translocation signal
LERAVAAKLLGLSSMKTIPPSCPEPETGPKYWRSLDQLADAPEFRQWVEREFPSGASELTDPVSRRHFVRIMSASFLLGGLGLTGCRKPEEHIHPFSSKPEGYIHGVPQYYATARPTRGSAIPLLVKSNDGRPTKVEGNPKHPASSGGSDRYTQASILNLYDPDRAMNYAKNGKASSKQAALDELAEISTKLKGTKGRGLAIVAERSSSPSRQRLQQLIAKNLPQAQWFAYEAVDLEVSAQAASIAVGKAVKPHFHLDKAARILSLDCDFIGAEEDAYRLINGFAKGRKIAKAEDDMNRLYVIEGLFTLTGANADHRLQLAPSQVLAAAARLLQELGGKAGPAVDHLAGKYEGDAKWIAECAKDLAQHKGKAVVLAGYGQPLAVHLVANAINNVLGAIGSTVSLIPQAELKEGTIADLAKALAGGQVDTLVELGGNLIYNAPADLEWTKARTQAKTVIRLGYYEDESFAGTTWHFPQAHYLESWGDARTSDGIYVSIQPLIQPLFGGMTDIEVLARLAGVEAAKPYDIVRETFKTVIKPDNFEEAWKRFLHDGFWQDSAPEPIKGNIDIPAIASGIGMIQAPARPSEQQLEVVFHRDYKVDDGRYNNNGWLQELPDPITKMCWDNVILLSPATAKALGVTVINEEKMNLMVPLVKIEVGGRSIEGPAWIQPGQADNVIGLALGYGCEKTGRVGKGTGYDAYKLRTSAAPYIASGAKLTKAGKKYQLSTTQDHWAMEGRPIIREANLEQYRKNPNFTKKMDFAEPPSTTYPGYEEPKPLYPNPLDARQKNALHQWGMVIDLTSCVGCNTCSVACQSENNIPIVGKEQVFRGREMHWLRVDRYFAGAESDPQMVYQPMLCQHCEAAPCENVCPVNATVHDEEGLNVMVYNRCVGTRYCSNNCPYKVRRFNFFDYHKRTFEQLKGPWYDDPITGKVGDEWGVTQWLKNPEKGYRSEDEWSLLKLLHNPDVTARMRGVMEKCTFCLQRIEGAKITQKVKAGASGDVRLKESEGTVPKTACQQACPADAIVFGDMSDPESQVAQLKKQDKNYTVLDFLFTRPRLTYLAKIRNPNPDMPDYKEHPLPHSAKEYKEKHHTDPFEAHAEEGAHGSPAATANGAKGHEKGAH